MAADDPNIERCVRCAREAPPAVAGAHGRAAQGWTTREEQTAGWPDYLPEETDRGS